MKVGHKYYGHGAYVKVVKVTNDVAEVVWGHNGSIPKRDGDRYWRKPLWDGFVEVESPKHDLFQMAMARFHERLRTELERDA